jgi:hypothetical protein
MWLLIDPGAFVMERKMLKEIKRLAEAYALEMRPDVPDLDRTMARMGADAAVDAAIPG